MLDNKFSSKGSSLLQDCDVIIKLNHVTSATEICIRLVKTLLTQLALLIYSPEGEMMRTNLRLSLTSCGGV